MAIRAVFFDIGETLINESRIWSGWARWLGVSDFTLFALLGAAIARGEPHLSVLAALRPGFDLEREEAARERAGVPNTFDAADLYPDATGCLRQLKREGYILVAAGNQPAAAEGRLQAMGLGLDGIVCSEAIGVSKPDTEFFQRIAREVGVLAGEAAYVGDRIDNDILPARTAGMRAVFLRRGPWAHIQAGWPQAGSADLAIDALGELPEALERLGAGLAVPGSG